MVNENDPFMKLESTEGNEVEITNCNDVNLSKFSFLLLLLPPSRLLAARGAGSMRAHPGQNGERPKIHVCAIKIFTLSRVVFIILFFSCVHKFS